MGENRLGDNSLWLLPIANTFVGARVSNMLNLRQIFLFEFDSTRADSGHLAQKLTHILMTE